MWKFVRKKKCCRLSQIPDSHLNLRAVMLSDKGCVRDNNEDEASFFFIEGNKCNIAAVLADGMGGHADGEIASKLAVETILSELTNQNAGSLDKLSDAYLLANQRILAETQPEKGTMGTTCTTLLIENKQVWCAHIGDSRLYLSNSNGLLQITKDHTLVEQLLQQGKIKPEEARSHPERNFLLRAMGSDKKIQPDVFLLKEEIYEGDRFLLCSDGLYDLVHDDEIEQLMRMKSIRLVTQALIALAKERGGYDNITLLIVEVSSK